MGHGLHFYDGSLERNIPYLFHSHVSNIFQLQFYPNPQIPLKLVRHRVRTNPHFITLSPTFNHPILHQITQFHHPKIPTTLDITTSHRTHHNYHKSIKITFHQSPLKLQSKLRSNPYNPTTLANSTRPIKPLLPNPNINHHN